jgi:hypothetical protein
MDFSSPSPLDRLGWSAASDFCEIHATIVLQFANLCRFLFAEGDSAVRYQWLCDTPRRMEELD